MSLNELAALIRHVDLNPEDKAATTRLRSRLRASDSSELMKALSLAQKLAESHRFRKVADIRPTAAASARIESASLAVIKYCVVSDAPNQLARLQLRQVMQSHHAFSRASILRRRAQFIAGPATSSEPPLRTSAPHRPPAPPPASTAAPHSQL